MFRSRLKTILVVLTTLVTLIIILPCFALWSFGDDLDAKLEAKKILRPTEFVAPLLLVQMDEMWTSAELIKSLEESGFRRRNSTQTLLPGDFSFEESNQLFQIIKATDESYQLQLQQNQIKKLFRIEKSQPLSYLSLGERVIAQYVNKQPVLQKNALLGEYATHSLNAVMAIEDNNFLEHKGVSYLGIARALVKNVITLRPAQGGSTITQQLVKNYFLSPEKTLSRKFNEFFLAINLESKFTKDQILETYLNIIYMGQSGSYQIRGFSAAAEYYFEKKLNDLTLAESALLAAIINNPGHNNPWKNAKQAEARRKLVLTKMKTLQYISDSEYESAVAEKLPQKPKAIPNETAPYFIDAATRQVTQLGIPVEGSKILISLNLRSQEIAQTTLQGQLNQLEKSRSNLKKWTEKNIHLETSLISVENGTGIITAAVGGRSFRNSQFNRLTEAKRQVGSLVKPFVYLTAIKKSGMHPTQLIENSKLTIEYEGQKWSPENYEKNYSEPVPAYVALKNSLNIPAARTTMSVGVKDVIETLYQFGFTREIQALPSISLGSFEQTLLNVIGSYAALARFGFKPKMTFVLEVTDSNQKSLFSFQPESQLIFSQSETAVLVSMLKQTNFSGTAKLISAKNFAWPSAGKTGTTNDYKDAWYVGFTPRTTALIWVGYDQNQSHGLTGATAAVPAWIDFMNATLEHSPHQDWSWPADTEIQKVKSTDDASEIDLLFLKK